MIGRMTYELGQGTGPLRGVKVVEVAGIGPGPHACMLLADLGADVIRVDRPGGGMFGMGEKDVLNRGRPSVALDLKQPVAVETVLRLVEGADVLVEGMRPGATERLGLGPEDCWARNPRLVYGRMTGWGQEGPFAHAAGRAWRSTSSSRRRSRPCLRWWRARTSSSRGCVPARPSGLGSGRTRATPATPAWSTAG